MKIEDNFLEQDRFDELQPLMMGINFPWFNNSDAKTPIITKTPTTHKLYSYDKNKIQFIHVMYENGAPHSPFYENMIPIIRKLQSVLYIRIKANLLTKTPNIVENEFHSDLQLVFSEEKVKQWTTSIFYVNTNNGYTVFEDGTKIESVANRMISFPANLKHTGTSCSDETVRVFINFNYFK